MFKSAKIYSIISQQQIVGQVKSADSNGLGIVGGILAAKETADRYSTMNAQMAPLRSLVSDLDFRRDFRSSIRHAFHQNELAGVVSMMEVNLLLRDDELREWKQKQITAANNQPVLMLTTSYRLEPNRYAYLIVTTNVDFFMPGSQTPNYSSKVEYESVPVTGDITYNQSWKVAMARWQENSAAAYRAAYREALDETMKMLNLMLISRPKALAAPEGQKEVAREKYRSVMAKSGELYSWPRLLKYPAMVDSFPKLSPDRGRLYVYRDLDAFPQFQPTVRFNQLEAGVLNRGAFLFADLPAGEYDMSLSHVQTGFLDGMNSSLAQRYGSKKFQVEKGKVSFIKLLSTGGMLMGEQRLELVDAVRGQTEMQDRWPADGLYPEYVIRTRLTSTR